MWRFELALLEAGTERHAGSLRADAVFRWILASAELQTQILSIRYGEDSRVCPTPLEAPR